MGKSTLAQYVYNDKRVEEYFDVRMWVCISRKLDIHHHTREIIECAAKGECPRLGSLDTLHYKLKDILEKSQRFLLVLDDVWFQESDNETEWEQLVAPLISQQAGSKVLITSRRDTLPAALFCKQVIRLGNMEDAEFLALFKHHAFSGVEIEEQLLRLKLEQTAEKIAKRLGQSPLAAKVLGSRLSRKKDVSEWNATLKIDNLSEPRRALLWSYEKLDPRTQRCFLYCSLFPKGHKYNIDEMVHLWVAEGLVDSYKLRRRMEDVATEYFNEMVCGSFFQLVSERYMGSWYVMHDLLHDLAESLAREDCFRLEDDKVTEIPCTIRHLSVRVESMEKHRQIIHKLHHLRTVICIDPLIDDASDFFDKILQHLKKLRVLYLSFYNSSKLPESVGELKHIRYLNLIRTLVSELPKSLCTLYHLQFLLLNAKVKSLPNKLCNLSKLHRLEGYDSFSKHRLYERPLCQIPNIGKLTSLQHLHEFSVHKEKGYELQQLKDLNELAGCLTIKNLENITGKDEALESKLYQKNRLKELQLVWSGEKDMDAEDSLHLDILEGLKPPPQLSGLAVIGYKSGSYPSWLHEHSYFESLGSFKLADCSVLEGLPLDSELFWHCSNLRIDNVPNFKTLSCLPTGLTRLSIHRCPLLMFVTKKELEQHDLRENMITDYLSSKLASLWEVRSRIRSVLSEEHSSLKQLATLIDDDISEHLRIINMDPVHEKRDGLFVKEDIIRAWLCCHEQRMRFIYGRSIALPLVPASGLRYLGLDSCSITDGALAACLGGLASLETLVLDKIMTLTALPSEGVFKHLRKLDYLFISSCWCLRSLGGLRAAASLRESRFICCPCLELARGAELLPLSLVKLFISGCMLAADSFGNGLPQLNGLSMFGCRSTPSLSITHLTSLKELSLGNFPDLCFLEGLSSLYLLSLHLTEVPKLSVEFISQFRVQRSLYVSSTELLNHMLMAEGFTIPTFLCLENCKESSVTFEESASFSSVKHLRLCLCEMKSLPGNLKCFSSLEELDIHACPNISSLPDLPSTLQRIYIWDCELLKESCRAPDGESWPKIAHIRWKEFR